MRIDELKPGLELNEMIAEKVMGWKWETYWTMDVTGHVESVGLMGPGGIREVNQYPDYSTDIAAAWQVVEKFLPYFRIESNERSEYSDDSRWHVDIWYPAGHACVMGIDTAPHAICLAALKAIEAGLVEVE